LNQNKRERERRYYEIEVRLGIHGKREYIYVSVGNNEIIQIEKPQIKGERISLGAIYKELTAKEFVEISNTNMEQSLASPQKLESRIEKMVDLEFLENRKKDIKKD